MEVRDKRYTVEIEFNRAEFELLKKLINHLVEFGLNVDGQLENFYKHIGTLILEEPEIKYCPRCKTTVKRDNNTLYCQNHFCKWYFELSIDKEVAQ